MASVADSILSLRGNTLSKNDAMVIAAKMKGVRTEKTPRFAWQRWPTGCRKVKSHMDPSKRQLLQEALAKAVAHNSFIAVGTTKGERIFLQPDFTCYENHVEGTSREGEIVSLTYADIASVGVSQ
jgi:hypothetical protein